MLNIIGRVRLPSASAMKAKEWADGESRVLEWREVTQSSPWDDGIVEELVCQSVIGVHHEACSLLAFRRVSDHDDAWGRVLFRGKSYAPLFLHVVMHGRAAVGCGKKVIQVRKGDCFVIDPNVMHRVESNSLCVTMCVTIPKAAIRPSSKFDLGDVLPVLAGKLKPLQHYANQNHYRRYRRQLHTHPRAVR